VKELVKADAEVNLQYRPGYTSILIAVDNHFGETVEKGADVNLQDDDRNVPLVTACKEGKDKIVDTLENTRADVNGMDEWGTIPLITAYKRGHVQLVDVLN
jgi:ankyrin repeat protein